VASGANAALNPQDVEKAAEPIRAADVLLLQLEIPMDTVACAARLAAQSGVPVILDPAPAPAGPLDPALLSHVSYLKPNETEAERLTGVPVHDETSARAAAEKLLQGGARHVIITMGAKGALVVSPGQTAMVPSCRVAAVDSTAAGDAFSGALACALARGEALEAAVRYASLAGALSVTRLGAQPSLPTAAELAEFEKSI
jgi:ribokinase